MVAFLFAGANMTIELPKPIAVTPVPNVRYREFTKCGQKPLSGGQIWTYDANSTTPKVTYQDPYGLTPNTNPIVLDAAGEADIYLDGTYRFVVKDKNGVIQKDVSKIGSWYSGDIEDQFKSLNDALETSAQQLMQPLQDAIDAALAAGAGDAGWTDTLISTGIDGGKNQNSLNRSSVYTVETIDELKAIDKWDNRTVYVKSIEKNYTYNSNLEIDENGVTVVGKWEMEIQDAYYASWFCPQNSIDNALSPQTSNIQNGYKYATDKKKAFVIDNSYYVESTSHNASNSFPALTGNDSLHYAIRILSNSSLIFKKGVGKLKLVPNDQAWSRILCVYDVENYLIFDPELIGDKSQHLTTTGEQHKLLAFHASRNGYVRNPICRDSWGDGIYFGYAYWTKAKNGLIVPQNLVIDDAKIYNSSRNALSLCGASNLRINNLLIDKVDRIAPVAGIDIEPEEDFNYNGGYLAHLEDVKIANLTIKNCDNYGVMAFIYGNRNIDVSFTGTTTIVSKAPNYCSFPIWFKSYRGEETVANYKSRGSVNFEKIIHDDIGSKWNTAAFIVFYSELAKVQLNVTEFIYTRSAYSSVVAAIASDSPLEANAGAWSGGLSIAKLTLNNVQYIKLIDDQDAVKSRPLKNINLPIDEAIEVTYWGKGLAFEDNVNIGGHARLSQKGWYNTDELINNTLFTPKVNPDDGNSIQSRIYDLGAKSNGRVMQYSLEPALTTEQIGDGLYAHCGKLIRFTSPLSSVQCNFLNSGARRIKNSFGTFTIY